ncbi:MAG TPA: Mpo1-like protein [Thermoanaerobaculia bacterium]|nr:Mpo1-like protein [Thermoanaerobaculia bacterium]
MTRIESLFADYASYHRTKGNKWFHRFGIPLIQLTLIGMLTRADLVRVDRWTIDVAMVLIAASTIYYLSIEWRLALAMLFISIGMYFLGAATPFWINVGGFVLGWIFQFIGHSVYEKRQPAFFRNFVHLLVGPLWILNDLLPVVKTKTA